jgi:hypothetical protein
MGGENYNRLLLLLPSLRLRYTSRVSIFLPTHKCKFHSDIFSLYMMGKQNSSTQVPILRAF